ncbi:sensor histidine kinase [Fulvivirga sp. 29W222]|uniref:Sensor histidine kinase n=1 Tax=Fulvivirga marina TaxID=2494733 RepID=A0A937KEA4_9BACT|nr:sensor histidine kinase [Fulvivirga marina]MBL6449522.1 sensor histidine kinase [Fulvivirga marina]
MIGIVSKKSFWVKQLKEIGVIILISLPFAFVSCPDCFKNPEHLGWVFFINSIAWVTLWKGNSYVADLIDTRYYWVKYPVKRLMLGILGHVIYTCIAIVCIFYALEYLFDISMGNIKNILTYSVVFTMLISLILYSVSFLRSWRELAVESERMKKEVISSKYESLKNQVNPHFLFNSLNALTNLVYEDQDQAVKFIKKLSDVYRYVLESRDKDLEELEMELKFAESYLFLQKIRYSDSLQVSKQKMEPKGVRIPPLSIQMLLENAIKHNIISEDEPLQIDIYQEGGYLFVVNNLQKKNIIKSESSEMGLANIKARYSFFTEHPVIIDDSDHKFTVGLPLLK